MSIVAEIASGLVDGDMLDFVTLTVTVALAVTMTMTVTLAFASIAALASVTVAAASADWGLTVASILAAVAVRLLGLLVSLVSVTTTVLSSTTVLSLGDSLPVSLSVVTVAATVRRKLASVTIDILLAMTGAVSATVKGSLTGVFVALLAS